VIPDRDLAWQDFAPALIMLRVVLGRSHRGPRPDPDTEWSSPNPKISALQFGSNQALATMSRRTVTSSFQRVPTMVEVEVIDSENSENSEK
jgi:hypothetical protein